MSREVELGAGALAVTTGLTLVLTLPPAWWLNMPIYFVHLGIVSGTIIFILGISIFLVGYCRYADQNKLCKKIISEWDKMWKMNRAIGVFGIVMILTFLAPFAWHGGMSASGQAPTTTFNAPNNTGIVTNGQSGGTNTINEDPRNWGFTQDQMEKFEESLPASAIPITVYTRLNDLLAKNMRDQLVTAINSVAGWQAHDMGDWVTNTLPDCEGVVIETPDPNNPPDFVKALIGAFQASGIQPQPNIVASSISRIDICSPPN